MAKLDSREYYARQHAAEMELAAGTANPGVARIHRTLAAEYGSKLQKALRKTEKKPHFVGSFSTPCS